MSTLVERLRECAGAIALEKGRVEGAASIASEAADRIEQLENALAGKAAAAPAERSGAAKVKSLEWDEGYAFVPVWGGHYHIAYLAGRKAFFLSARGFPDLPNEHFDTEEAAKAAAQADYECRMLSALSDTEQAAPEPDRQEAVAAWIEREALAELQKYKDASVSVCSGLLTKPFGDKVALYTHPAEREVTEIELAKREAMDALLQADDVWTDYGSGFRVHFSFNAGSGHMSVVERINTARALKAALSVKAGRS